MTVSPLTEMVRALLQREVGHDLILLALETAERHASSRDASRSQRDAKLQSAERSRRYRAKRHSDASRDGVTPHIVTSSILSSVSQEKTEEEDKKKVRARKSKNVTLRDDWHPNERHFAAAEARKISPAGVAELAEDMRLWARSNGTTKKDWDATFHGFIRRDNKYGAMNERANKTRAYSTARPPQTHEDAVLAGMANLAKKRGLLKSSDCGGEVPGRDDATDEPDADGGAKERDQGIPGQLKLVASANG